MPFQFLDSNTPVVSSPPIVPPKNLGSTAGEPKADQSAPSSSFKFLDDGQATTANSLLTAPKSNKAPFALLDDKVAPPSADDLQDLMAGGYKPTDPDLRTIYAGEQSAPFFKNAGKKIAEGVGGIVKPFLKAPGEIAQDPSASRVVASLGEGITGAAAGTVGFVAKPFQAGYRKLVTEPVQSDEQNYQDWRLNYLATHDVGVTPLPSSIMKSWTQFATPGGDDLPDKAIPQPYPQTSAAISTLASLPMFEGASELTGLNKLLVTPKLNLSGKALSGAGKLLSGAGKAAETIGELPKAATEGLAEKVLGEHTAEKIGKFVDIGEAPVAGAAALLGHPYVAGAIAGAKALQKVAPTLSEAGQYATRLAEADPASPFGRLYQVAKDANAPEWMRELSNSWVAKVPAAMGEAAGTGIKAGTTGALFGGGLSALSGDNPEDIWRNVGAGAALGVATAAVSGPALRKERILQQTMQSVDNLYQAHIADGIQPEALAKVGNDAMTWAATAQQMFGDGTKIRFAPEGKDSPLPQTVYGQAGQYVPETKTAWVNLSSKRAPAETVLHEIMHPMFDQGLVSNTELKQTIADSMAQTGQTPVQAKIQYVMREIGKQVAGLPPEAQKKAIADRIAARDQISQQTSGDPDNWIYSELMSEAAVQALYGQHPILDVLDKPGLVSQSLQALQHGLEQLGVTFKRKEATGDKPATVLPGFENVIDSQPLRKMVYQLVRAQKEYLPGISEGKAEGIKVSKEMWGQHPGATLEQQPDGTKANDFVIQGPDGRVIERSPRQVKKIVKSRRDEINALYPSGTPVPASDTSPEIKMRKTPSGVIERSGTVLGPDFDNLKSVGAKTKALAREIEKAIAEGGGFSGWYQQIGHTSPDWKSSVHKDTGAIEAQYKDFIPYAFKVDKQGNMLVQNYSLTAFQRKAGQWAERHGPISLDLWGGDIGHFSNDVATYLKNHSEGKPGEDNGLGLDKKNAINAFLVGGNRAFGEKNPLRASLKGEDRQGVVRSYRLDRLETLDPLDTGFKKPDYSKQVQNLSPDTGDAARLTELKTNQSRTPDEEAELQRLNAKSNQNNSRAAWGGDWAKLAEKKPGTFSPDTEEFKKWSGGAPLVSGGFDVYHTPGEKPVVIEAYHGTTHDFNVFDPSKANPENDFGQGIYLSNEPGDVESNYAGAGPDLSNRIERRAEQIFGEKDSNQELKYGTPEFKKAMKKATAAATKELSEHGGATMKVYAKFENPLKLGGDGETRWDMEYSDQEGEPTGKLVDFMSALQEAGNKYGENLDLSPLYDEDGQPASKIIKAAKDIVGVVQDPDTGDLVGPEVIRDAIERMGYDGIIDATVDEKFGSQKRIGKPMSGMNAETSHIIAFKPEQIKSATGNKGTYDANNPDIRFSPDTAVTDAGKKLADQGYTFQSRENEDGPESPSLYLAIHNDKGYVGSILARLPSPTAELHKNTALIDSVKVDPKYRKQGLSEVLYREMATRLQQRGVKEVTGFVVHPAPLKTRDKLFGKPIEKEVGDDIGMGHPTTYVTHGLDPSAKFSPDVPPKYYSQLQKTIDEKFSGESMPKAQLRAMVRNNTAGIKLDELKWSGLDDLLNGDGRVTKAEVKQLLKDNQIKLTEIKLSGDDEPKLPEVNPEDFTWKEHTFESNPKLFNTEGYPKEDTIVIGRHPDEDTSFVIRPAKDDDYVEGKYLLEGDWGDPFGARDIDDAKSIAAEYVEGQLQDRFHEDRREGLINGSTKYSDWQLPGGEDYREILFQTPPAKFKGAAKLERDYMQAVQEVYRLDDKIRLLKDAPDNLDGLLKAQQERSEAQAKLDIASDKMHEAQGAAGDQNFKESHWDQPNVLAHTRVNERISADGKPGLFVEEIQSDWHQQGRDRGYQGDEQPVATHATRGDGFWRVDDASGKFLTNVLDHDLPKDATAEQALSEANERLQEFPWKTAKKRGVPEAPLKKTWHEFVFRRLAQMAAQEGKDWIGWTTGEQQTERYDLSKQVSLLSSMKEKDGKYLLYIEGTGGQPVFRNTNGFSDNGQKSMTPEEMESTVGKETAAKLIAGADAQAAKKPSVKAGPAGFFDLSGGDLKLGGEGMKGFYDKILVDYANKFGKKFGAHVKTITLPADETAAAFKEKHGTSESPGAEPMTVHAMQITPEMKKSVTGEGVSIFSPDTSGPERIVAPAVQDRTGKIHTGGAMHMNVLLNAMAAGHKFDPEGSDTVDGFVTSKGRFVDRDEAAKVAAAASQIPQDRKNKVLMSEDLKRHALQGK